MSKMIFDAEFIRKAETIQYLAEEKKVEIALDETDYDDIESINDIVIGTLESAVRFLTKNKSKDEPIELSVGNLFTLSIAYREDADNYIPSATADAGFKELAKEEYDEDDE